MINYDLAVRENSREAVVFTLKSDGVAYDLGANAVRLIREDGLGNVTTIATTDVSPILTVTDASGGEVTLLPAADTWEGVAADHRYELYFEVSVSGRWIAFPEDENLIVKVIPKIA